MTSMVGICWRKRKLNWEIAIRSWQPERKAWRWLVRLDQAITLLSSASSQVKLGSLQQARYDARIDQLRQLQERFKPYQKM